MYSEKIEKAIRVASDLHKNQVRKGQAALPYVSHLFSVALIVMEHTNEEDIAVAALLHDTIEDTPYTAKELERDFGDAVCQMVLGVSEPQSTADRHYSWKERKEAYSAHLAEAPTGSLIVSAADKIHNMTSIIDDYGDDHERFVMQFGGSLSDRVAMYQDIADVLNERLDNDILEKFNQVFTAYKAFIAHVQETYQKK